MTQIYIFITTIIITSSFIFFHSADSFKWGYDADNGPSIWGTHFPTCGSGTSQSPINISPSDAVQQDYFISNSFHDIDMNGNLYNKGQTVEYILDDTNLFTPSVTILTTSFFSFSSELYLFSQLHFHWGSVDGQGQEHVINNIKGVGELHLVYYNSDYDSLSSAVNSSDSQGLIVFGYILEVGTSDFDTLLGVNGEYIDQVTNDGDSTASYQIRLDDMSDPCTNSFCESSNVYYVYDGSLTTPGCAEVVTWFVSANNLRISQVQLDKLRLVSNEFGRPLADNYRSPQNLNFREIRVTSDASSAFQFSLKLYLITILITLYFLTT